MTFLPTGDAVSVETLSLRFIVPITQWPVATLIGFLDGLRNASSWQQVGALTPAQAAALFGEILDSFMLQTSMVGSVVAFAADNMQYIDQNPSNPLSQWRKCDGAFYDPVAFPDLFARIGYAFGRSGSDFAIPDLRGRVVVDAGSGSGLTPRALADTFGEETHQLTVSELASHSHSYVPALPNATTIGPGAPQPTAIPGLSVTSAAGTDVPHNNVQPSQCLIYYIQVTP